MLQLSATPHSCARARAYARIYIWVCAPMYVWVCVCIYEVTHSHLIALMNFPVPLTWWVPTHVWGKGLKSLLTSTEGHVIIAYQSTPALVLELGVIKFPFDFPHRVRAAVRHMLCWDVTTAGFGLFKFTKSSDN